VRDLVLAGVRVMAVPRCGACQGRESRCSPVQSGWAFGVCGLIALLAFPTGTTTTAVNSGLRRARAQLERALPAEDELAEPAGPEMRVLARVLRALLI
jgi:hypothetical protein